METTSRISRRGRALCEQQFNGKTYCLYEGERYFSRGNKRLHRVVWEFYNGPIPKGWDVHHKDGDPRNNDISNLVCLPRSEHHAEHREESSARAKTPEALANLRRAAELAKDWHKSEAGHEWHVQHGKAVAASVQPVALTCKCCGAVFYSKRKDAKFCSNACKSKWRRDARLDDETRICAVCGREFRANRYSDINTCSASCGAKYRWVQRREKAAGL